MSDKTTPFESIISFKSLKCTLLNSIKYKQLNVELDALNIILNFMDGS